MGATKIGSIGRAIVARAVRFAIDGLEGPAHEEARESLELRLAESDRLLSVVEDCPEHRAEKKQVK